MKLVRSAIAGMALAIGVSTATPSVALDPAQSVFARKAIMWSMGAHMRGIRAGMKAGDGKTVAAGANAIAAMAGAFLNMFPVGTHQGSAHKSRAKSAIWAQNAKFVAAGKVLVREARALANVAGGGNAAAMGKQFGRMAKLGCGGCHRPFRGPKG